MRSINRWRHMMSSRVSVAPLASVDGYNKPTYGAAVTYQAHLSGRRSLVRDEAGREVVSSQSVYLETADNVTPNARVTLSTADVGSTESWAINPPILAVERRFDQFGGHHVVLRLK